MTNMRILAAALLCGALALRTATPDSSDRNRPARSQLCDPQARYEVTDIGVLPWVSDDVSARINSSGQISWWQAEPDRTIHAFTSNRGSLEDLGTLDGFRSSIACSLNARGDIVGWSVSGKNLVDSLATTHAFVYSHARMLDISTLGGRDSRAMGINESGEVVGWSSVSESSRHAFRYRGGKLEDLGTLPGGTFSAAYAISSSGLIAGAAETANHLIHAVTWAGIAIADLGTLPGGSRSRALALNDRGDIVGFSEADEAETHAFLYSAGRMQDLGSLGYDPVRANAINNHGQIVGASNVTLYVRHAFLWQDGKMQDLNKLLSPESKWRLQEAYDINDAAQILCLGMPAERLGERHLLLLKPATNPAPPQAAD
jgi:probable HAF family extracellular repeat protein